MLTSAAIKDALPRVIAAIDARASELNEADARLGDGDLGVSLQRGARGLEELENELPDDVGMALMKCAQAFTKVSGSSYGTLLATGLMSAARACRGRNEVPWTETAALLQGAQDAMIKRGRGQLGEKTVLDTIEAIRLAVEGLSDPNEIALAAVNAAQSALDAFRDQRSKQGRARIFAEKSVGLDDPGMLAFQRIVQALP